MTAEEWKFTKEDKAILELILSASEQTVIDRILSSKKANPSETAKRLFSLRREIGQRLYDIEHGVYDQSNDFVEGQLWIAQESSKGYYKGKEYPVTKVLENEVVIDGMYPIKKEEARKIFVKKIFKTKK